MKIKILSLLLLVIAVVALTCACNNRNVPDEQIECAHVESQWIVDREATVDSAGSKHTTCTICGEKMSTEIIPALSLTEDDVVEKLKAAVVKVICYDYDKETEISGGSGFFIDTDGTFITNSHVVRNCFYIKIENHLGEVYDVSLIYSYNDTVSDYAICKVELSEPCTAVEFDASCEVGDTVYALGYPGSADEMTVTSGKITDVDSLNGGKHYYLNSAPIDHGSSGGILANDKGRVIGMTTGAINDGEYVAIRYKDIRLAIECERTGGNVPLEYFHTVNEIHLNEGNMEEYFEIISYASTDGNEISYWLAVRIKDTYKNDTIWLENASAMVTVRIDTVFIYTNGAETSETDTQYLSFSFSTQDDLKSGVQQQTGAITDSVQVANISYSIVLLGADGVIYIYDNNH